MKKICKKILAGFSILIVLVIVQIIAVHSLQSNLYDNTLQLKEVEIPLKLLVKQGIIYGTIENEQIHYSILHIQKGDYEHVEAHKATYDAVNKILEDIFNRDSKVIVGKSDLSQEVKDLVTAKFKEIERLHNLMIDLGTKSFMAIDEKDSSLAFSLIMDGNYEKYSQETQLVVKDLSDIIDKDISNIENNILKNSQTIIYLTFGISIGILVLIILIMQMLISFIKTKEKELDSREKAELSYNKNV